MQGRRSSLQLASLQKLLAMPSAGLHCASTSGPALSWPALYFHPTLLQKQLVLPRLPSVMAERARALEAHAARLQAVVQAKEAAWERQGGSTQVCRREIE